MTHEYIRDVAVLFGLENGQIELLRHNENRTYRIRCGDRSYCLRLKKPAAGFDLSVFGGDPETLLRGELALIDSLGELTDIPVQKPLKTPAGDTVVRLPDGTLASLLTWMDGRSLDAGERTSPMLFEAGRALAKLRNAAEANPGLSRYPRLSYDQKLLERLGAKVEQGAAVLPADAIRSILGALRAVGRVMDELDGAEPAVIAHADPGFGNLIWTGGNVGLIDWSLSGTVHSLMDLGGLLGAAANMDEQRQLLEGWESVRGKVNRRHLDAYFSLNVLLFVCCQYTRAEEWANWFPAALASWQETIFDPLAAGRELICID